MSAERQEPGVSLLGRGRMAALGLGVIGLAAAAIGGVSGASGFYAAWLFAWRFWLGLALGSLGLLMLQHVSGGLWGYLSRRPFEAATRTLPLLAVLFVPYLFGVGKVYPWAAPAVDDPMLRHKALYLNVPFFIVRALLYAALWIGLAWLLNTWSRAQDETGSPAPGLRARALSGPGLVLLALSVTFASIDWIMSLEAHWYSTIYGFTWLVADGASALCLAILVLDRYRAREPAFGTIADAAQFRRLGNLLLTAVVLWTYMQFSQFLITWNGNLPHEIGWYLRHARGGWEWLAIGLAVTHFAAPLALLLFRANKDHPHRLATIAALLLVVRVAATFWMIAPAFRPAAFSVTWLDVAAFAGIGGLWLALFDRELARRTPLPLADARFVPVYEREGGLP